MTRPRNTIGRIEKLEQAYGVGVAEREPIVIQVQYVSTDGEIVGGYEVEVGKPVAPLETTSKSRRA
jgi:hypothetical protein